MLLKRDKLPSLTSSYRPISLMSSIMKLFERVIEQRLRSYLEDIGFINKYQTGFKQANSTKPSLTSSYSSISLMSSIMKLSERVIEQRLRSYLEDVGFINRYQSGFRQAKSTDDLRLC